MTRALVRPLLGRAGRAPAAWPRTGGWCAAATWRTPATASPSAPSAGWCPTWPPPAAGGWWPWRSWPATARPLAPCGRCRQLLYEHGGPDLLVDGGEGGAAHDPRRPAAGRLRPGRRGGARRPMTPSAVDVIRAKRDGEELAGRVDPLVPRRATRAATVADEQASALLMAVFFRGLSPRELATWTDAMIRSGERLDLSAVPVPTVDKHSTGGRGRQDLAAAVPAGGGLRRGGAPALGPGPRPHRRDPRQARGDPRLPGGPVRRGVHRGSSPRSGRVICSAGADLAPADRKLYALRDVTGTVDSIPLIASSIMSQEDRRGHRRAGARREGRRRRLHARPRPGARAGADDGRAGRGGGRAHRRAPHRHGHPPGPHGRQRARGAGVGGGAAPAAARPTSSR